MYRLLIKQFLRSRIVSITGGMLLLFAVLSISTGKYYLSEKLGAIEKATELQAEHIQLQNKLHRDDLGLLLYYLKFSFVNKLTPLAGVSIGQSDLHSHIQNVKILNLEGQKYDSDLVNPMRMQVGNLDVSFLIIFLFPLVIIALTFNLFSEEKEKGSWLMVKVQGQSTFKYLLLKLSVRILFLSIMLALILLLTKLILNIPFSSDFINVIILSYAYIFFWFGLCFTVTLFRQSSSVNAIALLAIWLLLSILLPVVANNYINNRYPIDEAYSMAIKQRDEYHTRWDTDKQETMNMFYDHYPQFSKYELQEEGFSWLWYYAMQQLGDDNSIEERNKLYNNIKSRETLSKTLAQYIPPMQVQLSMNDIAKTSLSHHIDFLTASTDFHEDLRLQFYSKIFDNKTASSVEWDTMKPKYFQVHSKTSIIYQILSLIILTSLLVGIGIISTKVSDQKEINF